MVGGTVIGLSRKATETLLHVRDTKYRDTCAVRCVEKREDTGEPVKIGVGDSVWWQCGHVLWTPKGTKAAGKRFVRGKAQYDVPLPKIGYTH